MPNAYIIHLQIKIYSFVLFSTKALGINNFFREKMEFHSSKFLMYLIQKLKISVIHINQNCN